MKVKMHIDGQNDGNNSITFYDMTHMEFDSLRTLMQALNSSSVDFNPNELSLSEVIRQTNNDSN